MASSSGSFPPSPMFAGEHYDLWKIVKNGSNPAPLPDNPTAMQIRFHIDEVVEEGRALVIIQQHLQHFQPSYSVQSIYKLFNWYLRKILVFFKRGDFLLKSLRKTQQDFLHNRLITKFFTQISYINLSPPQRAYLQIPSLFQFLSF